MAAVSLTSVVLDMDIYPRVQWSDATVNRYAEAIEAGDKMPPIVLEAGTDRLLDGMHRYRAHKQLRRTEIDAEHHEVPAGVPVKLYAAGLSARHGDRISSKELQDVAREIVTSNPEFSMQVVARYCGVTRKTVGKWCGDITDRRRTIRKVRALLLSRLGWSQTRIAEAIQVSQRQISGDLEEMGEGTILLTEDLLRDAADGSPWAGQMIDLSHVIEEIREEQIFASWSDDERALLKQLRAGEIVIVSMRGVHANLIEWADSAGLYVRIDRRTAWGNPFETPDDGDRETVIRNYAEHYLPHKPSLLSRLDELHGKALGCWCAPEACHGDVLKEASDGQ